MKILIITNYPINENIKNIFDNYSNIKNISYELLSLEKDISTKNINKIIIGIINEAMEKDIMGVLIQHNNPILLHKLWNELPTYGLIPFYIYDNIIYEIK